MNIHAKMVVVARLIGAALMTTASPQAHAGFFENMQAANQTGIDVANGGSRQDTRNAGEELYAQLKSLQNDVDSLRAEVRQQEFEPSRSQRYVEVDAWNRFDHNFNILKRKLAREEARGGSSPYFDQIIRLKQIEVVGGKLRNIIVHQPEGDEGLNDANLQSGYGEHEPPDAHDNERHSR